MTSSEMTVERSKKIDLQCADCEFSYARLGDYCFRHPEIVCPHPLEVII